MTMVRLAFMRGDASGPKLATARDDARLDGAHIRPRTSGLNRATRAMDRDNASPPVEPWPHRQQACELTLARNAAHCDGQHPRAR